MAAAPARPMKLSVPQVIASVTGAVLAALVASLFGVQGTIIGVAVGSAIATTAAALVHSSIDRTRAVARQAMPTGLQRTMRSRTAGQTQTTAHTTARLADEGSRLVARSSGSSSVGGSTARLDALGGGGRTGTTGRAGTDVRTVPAQGGTSDESLWERITSTLREWWTMLRRLGWRKIALATLGVFLLSLLVVTVVELAAGKSLSAIVGSGPDSTAPSIFGGGSQSPSPSPAPSTSTTLPAPRTTTTTGRSPSTSASTTTSVSTTSTTSSTSTTPPTNTRPNLAPGNSSNSGQNGST